MKTKIKYMTAMAIVVGGLWSYVNVVASDHDDGSQATATNNLNLTDLFVFREDNQTGNPADNGNLVLIMNTNGHTPPNQQVFFNTSGRYEFHISRVTDAALNTAPTGTEQDLLRFEFGEPDASNHQAITFTFIKDGVVQNLTNSGPTLSTTSLVEGKANQLTINSLTTNSQTISIFAGLREDPFFFDVEQFFRVRAGALGTTPEVGFRSPATAVDGFANQNVNSIIVRVPIALLQSIGAEPVFDVWETTSRK
jgi:hypothetical protein